MVNNIKVYYLCVHILFASLCVCLHTIIWSEYMPAFKHFCDFPEGYASCRSCGCSTWTGKEERGVSSALSSLSIGRYTITTGLLIVISKLEAFCLGIYSLSSSCFISHYYMVQSAESPHGNAY